MKAIHIDATMRTVREVEYSGIEDIRKMIGGYLEIAEHWANGDVCYVDEEGRLKGKRDGFRITRSHVGNGVLVGREGDFFNDHGDCITEDPTLTAAALERLITWESQR